MERVEVTDTSCSDERPPQITTSFCLVDPGIWLVFPCVIARYFEEERYRSSWRLSNAERQPANTRRLMSVAGVAKKSGPSHMYRYQRLALG
jgi:hypothetical protein